MLLEKLILFQIIKIYSPLMEFESSLRLYKTPPLYSSRRQPVYKMSQTSMFNISFPFMPKSSRCPLYDPYFLHLTRNMHFSSLPYVLTCSAHLINLDLITVIKSCGVQKLWTSPLYNCFILLIFFIKLFRNIVNFWNRPQILTPYKWWK